MTQIKIAAAYIRVSTDDQIEYSPESQISKIKEYAARNGYELPEEYIFTDDGISGRKAKNRPQFLKMIGIAKQKPKPFDAILVWKFSRFARNREDSIVYKSMLRKQYGIDVVSISENVGDDKMAILIEALLEAMDEFYSVNLSEEVVRGMTEKVTRGEPTCPPPFGYTMKEKKYYPDVEKAEIVRDVFTRYANGEKQREIAIHLGNIGVRTKYGKLPDNRFVDYMLNNPCYIGKLRWSRDGARAVSKRDYNNENIMIIDGHHEPIISAELWEATQKRLAEQKKAYPKYARRDQPVDYMLKGLVRCGSCGATLAMSTTTSGKSRIRTLQCCNYSRGSCRVSHSVTMPKVEAAFIEGLEKAVSTREFTISPSKSTKQRPEDVNYDRLIALEERKLERAKDAYLAEIDTIEQYKENKANIEKKIAELTAHRDSEPDRAEISTESLAKKTTEIIEFIKRDDVTEKAKNEALRQIVEKAVYDKANNTLAIFFHN